MTRYLSFQKLLWFLWYSVPRMTSFWQDFIPIQIVSCQILTAFIVPPTFWSFPCPSSIRERNQIWRLWQPLFVYRRWDLKCFSNIDDRSLWSVEVIWGQKYSKGEETYSKRWLHSNPLPKLFWPLKGHFLIAKSYCSSSLCFLSKFWFFVGLFTSITRLET